MSCEQVAILAQNLLVSLIPFELGDCGFDPFEQLTNIGLLRLLNANLGGALEPLCDLFQGVWVVGRLAGDTEALDSREKRRYLSVVENQGNQDLPLVVLPERLQ